MSTAMQIAEQVYFLAQKQHDAALMIGAYRALAATLYWSGDFETARQYARQGVQIWRLGNVQPRAEDPYTPTVGCLCYAAMSEWQLGEIASSQLHMDEAISLAKELNDMHALAVALYFRGLLAQLEHNHADGKRNSSELIELSTRHNFLDWKAVGAIHRGWALSVSGNTAEGIPWIEQGIRDIRAPGTLMDLPAHFACKAEALYLADRTSEALKAIRDAEAVAERFGNRYFSAELHRLHGVFLAAMGAKESQIGASFGEATRIAREQKSVSLQKRAEASYAEYRRRKASGSGGRGFRLPLW